MYKMITRIAAIGLASAAAGLLMPMAAASAATSPVAPSLRPALAGNTGFAGYSEASPTTGNAAATFTVPALTCPKASGFIGMASGAFLLTSGGTLTGSFVYLTCYGGAASYYGVIYVNGTTYQTPFSPAAGDEIQIVTEEGPDLALATMSDVTQNTGDTENGVPGDVSSAYDGIDVLASSSTGKTLPIVQFAKIKFTGSELNNGSNLAGSTGQNLVNKKGQVLIKTSALTSSDTAFNETFKLKGA